MARVDIVTPLLDTLQQVDLPRPNRPEEMPETVSRLAAELIKSSRENPTCLASDLYQSLLESAGRINRVSLAVTGLSWLGSGVQSVQQECLAIIRSARRELTLSAYSITAGAGTLIDELSGLAEQGVIVTLIVNNVRNQPREVLDKIACWGRCGASNIKLFDFHTNDAQQQLHAKVIAADRSIALVGSANLSFHGMVSNHELAVVLRGPIVEEIACRLDSLKSIAQEIDPQTISRADAK
jgi:phosphatidylserine/phosphatidylglycerophosphate/cardiolipin synthase-like enzyme